MEFSCGCDGLRTRTEDCDDGNTENIMGFLVDIGEDNCFSRILQ